MQTQSKGFVLTRQSRDVRGQTEIVLWVSTENGPARLVVSNDKPVCFIRQQDQAVAQAELHKAGIRIDWKPLTLKNFQHDLMAACYCQSIKDSLQLPHVLAAAGVEAFHQKSVS